MPITSDLTTVSGESLFSGLSSFTTIDIASNYLELDGCSTYSDVGSTAQINLSKIVNIGYIKDTSPFIIELYDVVGSLKYKIAQDSINLFLPASSFSTGSIDDITIVGVDS